MKLSIIVAACELELKTGKTRTNMLRKCLESIRDGKHDDFEALVCSDGYSRPVQQTVQGMKDGRFMYSCVPKRGTYGAGTQRNAMMSIASGKLLVFLDDDDRHVPGALKIINAAAEKNPGAPLVFCMKYPRSGHVIWTNHPATRGKEKGLLQREHVGTPMFMIPNDWKKLGRWGLRHCSDGDFIESTMKSKWPETVWFKRVIALVRAQEDREDW